MLAYVILNSLLLKLVLSAQFLNQKEPPHRDSSFKINY